MAEPVAVWSGEMSMCGITLHVHVLNDGQRIVDAADFHELMEAWQGGAVLADAEAAAFARWQRGGGLP